MDQETNNEYGIKVAMFISNPKYMGTISDEEAKELGASVFSYTYGDEAPEFFNGMITGVTGNVIMETNKLLSCLPIIIAS